LALHVNFYAYGVPSVLDFRLSPVGSFTRVFIESFTIVGVNSFILISGWFGIRPKFKRIAELLFQCVFFCCVLYGVGFVAGMTFELKDVVKNIFLVGKLNWFIKAYLGLYVLSPVLESFAESSSKRVFSSVLVSFFAFQTLYGWIFPVAVFISGGYSTFSFIGLYLLARYIRRFSPGFSRLSQRQDIMIYCLLSLCTAVFSSTTMHIKGVMLCNWFFYCSPLVIASALFLFLCFAKMGFCNSAIDALARSSYAVYLLHIHPCFYASFLAFVTTHLLGSLCNVSLIPVFLAVVFALSILLDRIRIYIWKRIYMACSQKVLQ